MNLIQLNQKVKVAQQQLENLQQQVIKSPHSEQLLAETIEELAVTNEELSVVIEELGQQNQDLRDAYQSLQEERHRYRDLFELAPDGYLVTDRVGLIQEANQAATVLFNVAHEYLIDLPLAVLVAKEDLEFFRQQLQVLGELDSLKDWQLNLRSVTRQPFPVLLTTSAIYDNRGNVIGLRWLIREISKRKQAETTTRP